jgi:hypothetical protein
MQRYFKQIRRRAQWRARRLGRLALGVALLIIGLGFLTAAVWAYLATEFSPILASLACSAVFFVAGGGFLLLAGAGRAPDIQPLDEAVKAEFDRRQASASRRAPEPGERPALLEAFLMGYEAYFRLRKRRE